MRNRRAGSGTGLAGKSLAALGLALATLGLALASTREEAWGQAPPTAKSKSTKANRSRVRKQNPAGMPIPKDQARPKAEDPLAKLAPAKGAVAAGKFHYTLKIRSFDEVTQLAASYFPPIPAGSSSPAILLVHNLGRSRKDFDDSIGDLKGEGLAEHLQGLGFAVLSFDLRGQGQNARRALTVNDRELMVQDLQAAYQFLVDRHNRGELNLSKFAVLGMGEGANLVAAWAFQPGAAMTIDERPGDINAMILISPLAAGHGYRLEPLLDSLASRFPTLVMAGDKDRSSNEAAKAASRPLARSRLNKVEFFPSALHGYALLRLEPRVSGSIVRFLEGTVKSRAAEYEPRYNLTPIAYFDIQAQKNGAPAANEKAKAKEQPKPVEKAKVEEKPKVEEKAKAEEKPKVEEKAKDQ